MQKGEYVSYDIKVTATPEGFSGFFQSERESYHNAQLAVSFELVKALDGVVYIDSLVMKHLDDAVVESIKCYVGEHYNTDSIEVVTSSEFEEYFVQNGFVVSLKGDVVILNYQYREDKVQTAFGYSNARHNCTQAVMLSFKDELGLSYDQASMLACGFENGMRCGSVCGSLTGLLMAYGGLEGFNRVKDENKAEFRENVPAVFEKFREIYGDIHCAPLVEQHGYPLCPYIVRTCVKLLRDELKQK